MIKSFPGQVVFCFAIPEPHLLKLAKTAYPSRVEAPSLASLKRELSNLTF